MTYIVECSLYKSEYPLYHHDTCVIFQTSPLKAIPKSRFSREPHKILRVILPRPLDVEVLTINKDPQTTTQKITTILKIYLF